MDSEAQAPVTTLENIPGPENPSTYVTKARRSRRSSRAHPLPSNRKVLLVTETLLGVHQIGVHLRPNGFPKSYRERTNLHKAPPNWLVEAQAPVTTLQNIPGPEKPFQDAFATLESEGTSRGRNSPGRSPNRRSSAAKRISETVSRTHKPARAPRPRLPQIGVHLRRGFPNRIRNAQTCTRPHQIGPWLVANH